MRARAQTHTHQHTPQVMLYSVPCNVLHWTDNKQIAVLVRVQDWFRDPLQQISYNTGKKMYYFVQLTDELLNRL